MRLENLDRVRNKEEKSFGGFARAIRDAKSNDSFKRQKALDTIKNVYGSHYSTSKSAAVTKSAMGETSGTIGGYIVPREYATSLLYSIAEKCFFFPRAAQIPMSSATTDCPVVDAVTTQAAGTAPWFGGALYTWGFEDNPLPETEPAFRQVSLTAWDLIGNTLVSNQWIDDTSEPVGPPNAAVPQLTGEERLINLFGAAGAWYVEYAMFQGAGSGTRMPLGIINAPCAIAVTRTTSNQITISDIANMTGKLLPSGWVNGIWACHPTVVPKLVSISSLQINDGNEQSPGCIGRIMTMPVFVTDKVPALGTKGDLCLFDPSLYAVGVRQEVLIDVSDQVPGANGFLTNQSWIRVWIRLDGKPMHSSTITLADGSNTVSSVVTLSA